jgi:hypothetical protein
MGSEHVEPVEGDSLLKRGEGKNPATFLGVPLQRWAIGAISLVAVLYAIGYAYLSLRNKYTSEHNKVAGLQAQTEDLSNNLKSVTLATEKKISEAEKHRSNKDSFKTITIDTSTGHPVMANYYASDGCLNIKRSHGNGGAYGISDTQDLWIPDPSRQSNAAVQTEPLRPSHSPSRMKSRQATSLFHRASLKMVSSTKDNEESQLWEPVQGGCLNPHPWPFRSWWGPASGCVAPLYRQWNDGCVHYQVYNACTGIWDPNVYWTFCSAQHHP